MNVLVPIDGSEPATRALELACEQHPAAEITALYVSKLSSGQDRVMAGGRFEDWQKTEESRAADVLSDARELASAHGIDLKTVHAFGDPLRYVVSYAEKNDIDQIVLGSRGGDRTPKYLLGSVAERVIRRAPMPVLVVK